MDLGLHGRVALVVGGTGFIGSEITRVLRAEGATVVVAARGEDADIRIDAADDASVAAGLDAVLRTRHRLDAVVMAAAPSAQTLDPQRLSDPALVREAFEGKALTFLRVANAVLPVMVEAGYGRLVAVNGQNMLITGNLAGSLRNASLQVAAKNLADGVAGTGVTVNTVNPGPVGVDPDRSIAPARPGATTPAEIAAVAAFLCSPLAAGVSGEAIALGHRIPGVVSF